RYRDLLLMRIEFADLVWPDIHNLFTELLTDPRQFMARSRVFELFRYDRCLDITPANLEATRRWTKFTTCLTRYEAGAAWSRVGLAGVRDFVDLGGNTGEFALQACRRNPALRAVVVDLPVVCEIGRRHVAEMPDDEAQRIAFFASDLREGALPAPADLVAFKSVLHDWPDDDARRLLARAGRIVRPGGRLLIFERAAIDFRGRRIPYALAPELAFLHSLRPADLYLATLGELGFVAIEHRQLALEMDYHLITARRPA
ncbi:MAG TPA: methyltransferase, partial [Stellaceae bacterium]|nr:methyltransferase [Stellaceae bacterium]